MNSKDRHQRKRLRLPAFIAALFMVFTLTACGEDPALTQFKNEIDAFCTKISDIDTDINSIDAKADTAVNELLSCLDDLDIVFQAFARLDFPEEFDNLEPLAEDAARYMTEAVKNYHDAYGNNSYNEAVADYAGQNYALAYKRIRQIITFLHGEVPEDSDLIIEY